MRGSDTREKRRDGHAEGFVTDVAVPVTGQLTSSRGNDNRSVPRHYVRPNTRRSRVVRLVTIDTETHQHIVHGYRQHTMRCWVARMDDRPAKHAPLTSCIYSYGTDADSLADQIAQWTKHDQTVWVYAHNLNFDAAIADLPGSLLRLGWELTGSHITESPIWFRLRKGRRRLILTDSYSLLQCSLASIADDMGCAKEPLPDNDCDDMAQWWARCETDVTILANALLRCMRWWDDNQLGRWSMTGSGCGWSAFRTHFITANILIDIDESAMNFERRAVYGGRREAFRLGDFKGGHFIDIDFRAAYPSIAAEYDVPVARLDSFDSMTQERHATRPKGTGIIAECVVSTKEPVVPCRYGDTIFYPVGTFRTILASPEIDLVQQTGGYVAIGRGQRYRLGPAMRTWGHWIRSLLAPNRTDLDPVVRRMVKHWSRATIGRWTMQLARRVDLDGFPTDGQLVTRAEWVEYHERDKYIVDGITHHRAGAVPAKRVKGWHIVFGDKYYALKQDVQPDNGFPAIWVWVESWCRVLLWQTMSAAAAGTVWQCDTDGVLMGTTRSAPERLPGHISDATGSDRGRWIGTGRPLLPPTIGGLDWTVKGTYNRARVLGPQHVILGSSRRLPGVPADAVEVQPMTFHAWTWPGFLTQLEQSTPGVFRQLPMLLKVGAGLNPRWTLTSGRTLPVTMAVRDGGNVILPPPARTATGARVLLADDQHAVLARVLRQ